MRIDEFRELVGKTLGNYVPIWYNSIIKLRQQERLQRKLKMKTIKWNSLTESAARKLENMLDGVENHQQPVAKEYGSGYKVSTIGMSEQAEKNAESAGWKLVK